MSLSNKQLLEALKDAILTERTGNGFYTMAARNTADPKGREVFLMLAAEESLHEDYLRKQYGNIIEGRSPQPLISDSGAELGGPSPVFSEDLRSRIGEAHWEMTALSVGLQLEQATIQRYRGLAVEVTSPELKHFFEKLARWEEGHAAALDRQSRLLREEYWNEARFAPF